MGCQHEGCACESDTGGFCSDYCREQATGADHDEHVAGQGCGCGHAACMA